MSGDSPRLDVGEACPLKGRLDTGGAEAERARLARLNLAIKSINGRTVASRRVTATTTWRSYYYTPRCGHRYRVVYTVPGGRSAYTVRVGYKG